MTNVVCQVCKATNDARLCPRCTDQLIATLDRLPALLADLRVTATRQARVGDVPLHLRTIPAEYAIADQAQAAIPAALRSKHGRITLPANPLPLNLDAAELGRQAVKGIRTWAVTLRLTAATIGRLCLALADAGDQLRQLEHAGQIHAKALDLVATIEATIDRREPDEFVGACPVTDVRVRTNLLAGPPCSGLVCDHESCEGVRRGQSCITLVPGPCGAPLLLQPGGDTVTCGECGSTHDPAKIREATAVQMEDKIGSVREVAGFLRRVGHDVTVDKIDGWLRRSRIVDYGVGPSGRLVKVGEVRAYAEALAERAKARRRERMSA